MAADDPVLSCERVVLTPLAADQTPEAVVATNEAAVDNIIAFPEGRPRVNAAQYSSQWRQYPAMTGWRALPADPPVELAIGDRR